MTQALLEQRSDPLCWDVMNRRTGGTESRSQARGSMPRSSFGNLVTGRETIKTIMRYLQMISQSETGDMKPDGGREREHTSDCRSAVFGARGALHERQWMMLNLYVRAGGTFGGPFLPFELGYLRHHLCLERGSWILKIQKAQQMQYPDD
jgi:hypothetical protein